jgi:uncharacterized protein
VTLRKVIRVKVLISGASGLLGAALVSSLEQGGTKIIRFKRIESSDVPASAETIQWNPAEPLSPEKVSGCDAVIHLAGESIASHWTAAKKAKIRDSRVLGTRNLAQALAQTTQKPRVFICASAIGYYGDRGDEQLTEESSPGSGFLPEVCREWEAAAQVARDAGIRTVHLRTGVVLSKKGGALAKMLSPFKLGLGGKIGSGRQWISWIDLQDWVGTVRHILQNDSLYGAVNLVAPQPVTNAEFTKTLARALSRPAVFPMPGFAVKLLFGKMGETILLGSQRVESAKLLASGYRFQFPQLRISLQEILRR